MYALSNLPALYTKSLLALCRRLYTGAAEALRANPACGVFVPAADTSTSSCPNTQNDPSISGLGGTPSVPVAAAARVAALGPLSGAEFRGEDLFAAGSALSLRDVVAAALTAAAVLAGARLVGAQRPATAIFGFLGAVLALVAALFALSAEYMAVLHLVIYPGAILIFFVFTTLTTEERWFAPAAEASAPAQGSAAERAASGAAVLLSGALTAVLLLAAAAPAVSLGFGAISGEPLFAATELGFGEDSTGPVALGTALFTRYRAPLIALGGLLLLALSASLRLLSPALRRSGGPSLAFSLRRRGLEVFAHCRNYECAYAPFSTTDGV